jgi:hypothetical protein
MTALLRSAAGSWSLLAGETAAGAGLDPAGHRGGLVGSGEQHLPGLGQVALQLAERLGQRPPGARVRVVVARGDLAGRRLHRGQAGSRLRLQLLGHRLHLLYRVRDHPLGRLDLVENHLGPSHDGPPPLP